MTSPLFKLHRILWWRNVKSNPTVLVAGAMILVYGLLSVFSLTFEVDSPEALHAPVAFGMAAMLILAMAMPANEQQITQETFRTLPIDNLKPAMALSSLWTSRAMLTILLRSSGQRLPSRNFRLPRASCLSSALFLLPPRRLFTWTSSRK